MPLLLLPCQRKSVWTTMTACPAPHPDLNLPPLKPPVPILSPSPDEPLTTPRGTPAPQPVPETRATDGASATVCARALCPAALAPPPPAPPPPAAHAPAMPPPAPAPVSGDYPPWLARLLGSEGTTAVFFDGTQSVEVERNGHREPAVVASADLASLADHLRKLAAKGVPRPEPDAPVIDATLADGTRITALFPPLV